MIFSIMDLYFDLTIIFILLLSLSVNVVLFFKLQKPANSKKELTYDVQALMRDLASGPALVKFEYVDRSDVLLRSPRHL